MTTERPLIALVPIGTIPSEVLYGLLPPVQARFPGRVACPAPCAMEHPADLFAAERGQYLAEPLLKRLAAHRRDAERVEDHLLGGGPVDERPPLKRLAAHRRDAERVLGVADLDLFAPGLNFIFGQAQRGGPAAVIALARLRSEFWGRPPSLHQLLQRAIKEAIHELGHTYGLEHCAAPECVMAFSNTLADTDRKSERFCARHAEQLGQALGIAA